MNYLEVLRLAAPETALAITVLMVLAVDLVVLRGESVARRFEAGATGFHYRLPDGGDFHVPAITDTPTRCTACWSWIRGRIF